MILYVRAMTRITTSFLSESIQSENSGKSSSKHEKEKKQQPKILTYLKNNFQI